MILKPFLVVFGFMVLWAGFDLGTFAADTLLKKGQSRTTRGLALATWCLGMMASVAGGYMAYIGFTDG